MRTWGRIALEALPRRWALASPVLVLLAGAAPAGETGSGDGATATLVVVATGLESDRGAVLFHLARTREQFEDDAPGFRGGEAAPRGGRAAVTFSDLPPGAYAVKLFHDENGNGKLDFAFYGPPAERIGYSNGARARFGPPRWDDARFGLEPAGVTLEIPVR